MFIHSYLFLEIIVSSAREALSMIKELQELIWWSDGNLDNLLQCLDNTAIYWKEFRSWILDIWLLLLPLFFVLFQLKFTIKFNNRIWNG